MELKNVILNYVILIQTNPLIYTGSEPPRPPPPPPAPPPPPGDPLSLHRVAACRPAHPGRPRRRRRPAARAPRPGGRDRRIGGGLKKSLMNKCGDCF